jgi:Tfp pilus assembly protein PilZ
MVPPHIGRHMLTPPKRRRRFVPPRPITVGIDDDNGLPLGYGVIPNVSEAGACVRTDRQLAPGGQLVLRIKFAQQAKVHEVAARVVWTGAAEDASGAPTRRYGLLWHHLPSGCALRLRHLAHEASSKRRTGSHAVVKAAAGSRQTASTSTASRRR